MRKVYLFLLFLTVITGFVGNAQCLTSPNGQWPGGTFTPTCNGTSQIITTAGFAGEYSSVNVITGNSYTFTSSITTDFITIGNSTGASAFTFGTGSVTWTSTVTGVIRFYTHTNSACGSNTNSRTRAVSCVVAPTTPTDLAATAVTGPTNICVTPTDTVFVTIKNTGINAIDFTTSNATVTVNITGASTQTLTATLNTGTIAPGASQVVQMAPFATFATPGTYNMSATVTVAGDGVAANNTISSSVTLSQAALPWAESFPTTATPAGWNTTGWTIASNHAVTTNGIFRNTWAFSTTGQFNTLPIGPLVGTEMLSFDFRILNFSTYPNGGTPAGNWGSVKVQVSTNCGQTYVDLATIDNTNHTQSGTTWSNKSYSLTPYAGQTIIIRILSTWVSGDYYVDFDNFNVMATPPVDLTVTGLSGLSNCPSPSQALSAVIKNVGLNTLNFATTPATVSMSITGAATQTLTATVNTGTLAPGASQTVLLTPNATMGASGTYNTNTTVTIAGDGNSNNNSYLQAAVVAATAASPWAETFPTTATPAGWTTTGWFIDPIHGRTSNGLTKNLFSGAPTGEFSTISVGPLGTADFLFFDYRILNWSGYPTGGTPAQTVNWGSFAIQVSTDCGITYTSIDTIKQSNHTMNGVNWTSKNYSLAAYAGQYVKVRIRAAWTSGDYYIDFDNFFIRPFCSGAPVAGTVSIAQNPLCLGASTVLKVNGQSQAAGVVYQWQSSSDSLTWNNITGATDSVYTASPTTATFYRLQVICSATTPASITPTPGVKLNVSNPMVLTSAGATNCGPGSVTLTATGSAGTTLNWYTSATGGASVGTGSPFTTPNLTASTTYYVSATSGGTIQSVGATSASQLSAPTTATTTNSGIRFDVLNPNVNVGAFIQSVDIYPTAPVGTAFQIVIIQGPSTAGPIKNSTNGTPLVYNGVTTVSGTAANPVAQVIPVNFQVPSGFDYIMVFRPSNPTALRNATATGATFPYSIPSVISLTGSTTAGTYQFFYNWRIGSGCESPRVAVPVTISANTAITTQPTAQSICSGATLQLTVVGVGAGVTYQWTKDGVAVPNSNNDTLTIPNAQPTNSGVYTVTLTGTCGTVTSQTITVNVSGQNTWLGAVSSDWNTAANWCGSIPTLTSDIVISSGTPYSPVVSGLAEVRNITLNAGASLGINANGFLNVWGNYTNQGTLNAQNGFIAFRGTTIKTATSMNMGTVIINGTGGVSLQGDWTVGTLILETGNVRLNSSSLSLNASSMGSSASHILTNGIGSVRATNVVAGRTIGVGADSLSYNPVTIANGQGRDFTVRVVTGIQPTITQSARAVNRTWTVLPSSPVTTPVEMTFQWADAHGNASVTAGGDMEVGVNSNAPGGIWNILTPPGGLTPSGGTTNRGVTVLTTTFGNFVVSSPGGFTYPLSAPNVDADVQAVQLMPNLVQSQTTLRVKLVRSTKIQWSIVDASGRVVRQWAGSYNAGISDEKLNLINLTKGAYFIMGHTNKGKTQTVSLIKE